MAAVLIGSYAVLVLQPAAANHIAYSKGDVFAAVGNGKINHYSATGTLLEALDTGTGATNPPANETGMCFDPTRNLYATDYDAFDMAKFNNLGGLISHPFGPNFPSPPETCVVDQAGQNIYVGTGELSNELFKLDTNGNVVDSFSLVRDQGGINWIDLNPNNQCQLYYTSEGTLVKRFDVCTHTQLSNFASGLPPGNFGCFGLRIRSNGEVLVACDQQIVQLNSSGSIIKSYNPGSESDFFALALDPDAASFWAAGYTSGHLYKVNIASGSVATNFVAAPAIDAGLGGLAVFGDDAVDPGYPRPKGATPLVASLVVAYQRCTSPNRQHGAPLDSPSCSPPRQSSGFLTVGTPDANGQGANSVGAVRFGSKLGNNTDVGISVSITDVRKKSDLSDYTGELQAASTLEITDRYNSAEPATQPFNDAGTAAVVSLPVTVPCQATADTTVGSNCAITTTADATVAGSVMGSKRTIWQMDQVQVFDGGSDGLASTAGNTLFVNQGVFVP